MENDYEINLQVLKNCIGREHSIATASFKDNVVKYQVMPDELEDQPFFDWYCNKYPNNQFFENIHECVTTYLHNRNIWVNMSCPKI